MEWTVDPQVEGALGTFGSLMAIFLFVSPMKTFHRIAVSQTVGDYSPLPYWSTLLNCTVWVLYALPAVTPGRTSPLVTNAIGSLFQIAYLAIFLRFAQGRPRQLLLRLLAGYAAFMGFFVLALATVVAPAHRSPVVGYFASIFTVVMFGSPLSVLAKAVRERSVEFMPLPLSLAGFLCSSSWALYGVYVKDPYIVAPNAVGVALGVVQLAAYAIISTWSAGAAPLQLHASMPGPAAAVEEGAPLVERFKLPGDLEGGGGGPAPPPPPEEELPWIEHTAKRHLVHTR